MPQVVVFKNTGGGITQNPWNTSKPNLRELPALRATAPRWVPSSCAPRRLPCAPSLSALAVVRAPSHRYSARRWAARARWAALRAAVPASAIGQGPPPHVVRHPGAEAGRDSTLDVGSPGCYDLALPSHCARPCCPRAARALALRPRAARPRAAFVETYKQIYTRGYRGTCWPRCAAHRVANSETGLTRATLPSRHHS